MAEIILPPEENEESPQTPELNIDKPTENSKVITIEFEAKKTNKVSTKDTNQQLYTTDTDAWFEFKETSLEGANGTYSVVFRNRHDGSIFQRTGDVVNGVAYYKIPHQEIRHAGAWRGQIVYTLSNGDTTAREFDYDVKGHILDGKDVREIVVEDFETLMSQLRSMKDNAEQELAGLVNTANQNETDRQVFFDDLVDDIELLQSNYQELLDTGVLQTNINTKLEQLEEEYAPKLTEVTAQLAQTNHQVGVNPSSYGAKGDGITDDTESFKTANEQGDTIRLERGKVYRLENFVPLPNTTIYLDGAIITRHSDNKYENTGSSGAIIIENEGVRIFGGSITDSSPTKSSFSGGIVVYKGSAVINGVEISGCWGGITGIQTKLNNNNVSYLNIVNCELHDNQHNTYLADIENLLITGVHTYNSSRDGIRTYRECKNIVITNSHIYDNGDDTEAQSRDGIDLYMAGESCIISNNFIYGNKTQGIDIKRNADSLSEVLYNRRLIISNNHIHSNDFSGVSISGSDVYGKIEEVIISDNLIFNNQNYGMSLSGIDIFNVHDNIIHSNGSPGVRVQTSTLGGIVHHNTVYDNGKLETNLKLGVQIVENAKKVDVTNNKIYSTGEDQLDGLVYHSNGLCIDNNVYNHTRTDISGGLEANGRIINTQFFNSGEVTVAFNSEKTGYISKIDLMLNTPGDFNIEISKRNKDGTFQRVLFLGDITVDKPYESYPIDLSNVSAVQRSFTENQTVYVKVSGEFSSGLMKTTFAC